MYFFLIIEKLYLVECVDFMFNFLKFVFGCYVVEMYRFRIKCQNIGVFVSWSLKYSILDFIYVFSIVKFNKFFFVICVYILY